MFTIVCWVSVLHLTYMIRSLNILESPPFCYWMSLFPWWMTYSSVSMPNSGLSDPPLFPQWNACYLSSTIIIVNVIANWAWSDLFYQVGYVCVEGKDPLSNRQVEWLIIRSVVSPLTSFKVVLTAVSGLVVMYNIVGYTLTYMTFQAKNEFIDSFLVISVI